MIVTRLKPAFWLHTPKGLARAHFLIIHKDGEQDDQWKCCQQETGEWWTWDNADVRMTVNITIGRMKVSKIARKL